MTTPQGDPAWDVLSAGIVVDVAIGRVRHALNIAVRQQLPDAFLGHLSDALDSLHLAEKEYRS